MNDTNLIKLPQVREFLSGTKHVEFKPLNKAARYTWIDKTLKRFNYHHLNKKDGSSSKSVGN